jgi:hypothetical protein
MLCLTLCKRTRRCNQKLLTLVAFLRAPSLPFLSSIATSSRMTGSVTSVPGRYRRTGVPARVDGQAAVCTHTEERH